MRNLNNKRAKPKVSQCDRHTTTELPSAKKKNDESQKKIPHCDWNNNVQHNGKGKNMAGAKIPHCDRHNTTDLPSTMVKESKSRSKITPRSKKNDKAFCNKSYRMTLKSKVQDERVTNKVKSDH